MPDLGETVNLAQLALLGGKGGWLKNGHACSHYLDVGDVEVSIVDIEMATIERVYFNVIF